MRRLRPPAALREDRAPRVEMQTGAGAVSGCLARTLTAPLPPQRTLTGTYPCHQVTKSAGKPGPRQTLCWVQMQLPMDRQTQTDRHVCLGTSRCPKQAEEVPRGSPAPYHNPEPGHWGKLFRWQEDSRRVSRATLGRGPLPAP